MQKKYIYQFKALSGSPNLVDFVATIFDKISSDYFY